MIASKPAAIVVAEWDQAHGPMFGGPAGIDHFIVTVRDEVWPEDGSMYAGRSYRTEIRYINGIVDSSSNYPTPEAAR